MNAAKSLNRRDMLLASGLFVSSLTQGNRCWGQAPDDKAVIFRTEEPRNAEPKLEDLVQSWITPVKHFYIRSHAANPVIDASRFTLRVEGMVERTLNLSLSDLKRLPEHTVTATLTCAGNRRAEYNQEREVGGVQWEAGAIGNADWTGVRLADVLAQAGVRPEARHVWFEGLDQIEHDGETIPFGASIPLEKANLVDSEVGALLAYAMNGQPLAVDHGFPLRTVVPGYIGARSVKWLGRILLSDHPSTNHFMDTAYKLVRDTQALDWAEAGPLYRYPVNAAIAAEKDVQLKAGTVSLQGYALPAGISGVRVKSVFVSSDGAKSWTQAELTGEDKDYCWQLWKADIEVKPTTTTLTVRAIDSDGNFMPPRVPWNAKGYMQNSWYSLPVTVQ